MNQITIPWPDTATWRKWAGRAAVILLAVYVVYVVREIWLPLFLAFLLAMVLDPVVDRMEARGWSRARGSAFIFFGFLGITIGLIWLSAPVVAGQISDMQRQFSTKFPDTSEKGLITSLKHMNVPESIASAGVHAYAGFQGGIQRSSNWLASGMSMLGNLIWVVIVPIVAFYALRDFHLILGKALLLFPRRRRDLVQTYVSEVTVVFAKYLRGLGIVSLMNGVATGLLLWAIHVPSALLLGIFAGILYSVPYIGAFITIVITAAVSFLAGGMQLMLLAVTLSVLLHQIVFDQVITPRVLGGHVGLHPIISIIALLAGNLLLGIVGMILAVPVAACIQIGVLALVPKLAVEMEVPTAGVTPDSVDSLTAESKAMEANMDATANLHESVKQAVADVESKADESHS